MVVARNAVLIRRISHSPANKKLFEMCCSYSITLQLNAIQKILTYLVMLARREVSEMDACSYHSKMLGFVDQTGGWFAVYQWRLNLVK
jgi:hypothetical protein